MHAPARIELLYWEGCPSHPEALALLESVLAEQGVTTVVELREVRTQADAERLGFPGSPTIRFDGRDVDPRGAGETPSLTCRSSSGSIWSHSKIWLALSSRISPDAVSVTERVVRENSGAPRLSSSVLMR